MRAWISRGNIGALFAASFFIAACGGKSPVASEAASEAAAAPVTAPQPQQTAASPDKTGGFDGQVRTYEAGSGALLRAFTPVPITATSSQLRSGQ